ncbi:MAG: hypothetical protein JXA15_00890 [Spirochaetales bacterium]|nr:hypothetical protein [Spirochaetales bacterium]
MTRLGPAKSRLFAIAACLLAALASCAHPLLENAGPAAAPTAEDSPRAALALPSLDGIAAFRVTGSGPDGAVYGPEALPGVTGQGGELVETAEPLALGEWTFTVEALDGLGDVVSSTSFSYTVDWNDERAELVLVAPESGDGSIVVTAWWPDGVVLGPGDGYGNRIPPVVTVEYEIEGTPFGATVSGPVSDGWFEGSVHALAPGRYLVRARVLANGEAVWGAALPALVSSGLQTTVSFHPEDGEVNAPPNVYAAAAPGEYLPFATTTLEGTDSCTDVSYTADGSAPAIPSAAYGGEDVSLGPWNIRIAASNAWGEQAAASVNPDTYSFAVHVATTGDDGNAGTPELPFLSLQPAIDIASSFANLYLSGDRMVKVRVASGTSYTDPDGLTVSGAIHLSGGWSPGFVARTGTPEDTKLIRNPPNDPIFESVLSIDPTVTELVRVENFTFANVTPPNAGMTTAISVEGSGRFELLDSILAGGKGDDASVGLRSIGGADLVLLRNRIWGGEGATDALGGTVRGVLVDGGSPLVYLSSNAIMARKPGEAAGMVDAVGVEIVADAGETVALRMYGNTVVADGDTSLALRLNAADLDWIPHVVVNNALAAPGGASAPAVVATNNFLTTDLAALADALVGSLDGIVDYADFAAMNWTPSSTTDGDALATGGSADPDPGTSDEDLDLAGTARTVPWSIGAMERE